METTMLQPEVKIISRENVKPSIPTPSHLRTFNVSMLDQIAPSVHVTSLIFYNNPNPQTPPLDIITSLKSALSRALVNFYPVAGRCKDESTIICNDEGTPFIVAHVNCSLSDVIDLQTKIQFCPPRDLLSNGKQHISELAQLAFQVNVFNCGGIVIGVYIHHKLFDGITLGLFFKHWSAHARKKYDELIQPDYESTVVAFPPYHPKKRVKDQAPVDADNKLHIRPKTESLKIVGKGFSFSDAALTKLKEMSASKHVPNPTRFEAVMGFVWEQCLAAESTTSKHTEVPVLLFVANIRKRVGPPVYGNSMGNLLGIPIAYANTGLHLPELVAEIHGAILEMDEKVKGYRVGGAEAVLAHRSELTPHVLAGPGKGTYSVSSWSRNGLSEVDFGFGKPSWIVFPVSDGKTLRANKNFISFTDYNHPDGTQGIVAWINLEEKDMHILESNQEFLAFASPMPV